MHKCQAVRWCCMRNGHSTVTSKGTSGSPLEDHCHVTVLESVTYLAAPHRIQLLNFVIIVVYAVPVCVGVILSL